MDSLVILAASAIQLIGIMILYRMKTAIDAVKVAVEQTEKNTNSMKDALVAAEKSVSHREGVDEGLATAATAKKRD